MTHADEKWLLDGRLVYALNERGTNSFTAHVHGEDAEAKARLISAAPDLLAVAKYARRFLNPSDYDVAFVDAAISKAEGKTQ